ncbi:biotin synthase BioB [Rhodoferax sp. 4810]|uniref:Biotin synthase n=1 Tax=Thiospirillum jenense TaxID=1653858 RepID=A0A839HLK5_9GAMM|nr:biotin synthase BioB [Thiospirillum jenense]MBB1074558.1 biotin synthase BioB [Rhodoferax jenense]MBB1126532.1 biotin synthase BioB [Thiospirillum jenense]
MTTDATVCTPRHDWTCAEIEALLTQPFNDLLFTAQSVHRAHFDPNQVQVSTLLSIQTGACSEDCSYCAQSVHHQSPPAAPPAAAPALLDVTTVLAAARQAHAQGATRFCMGASGRCATERQLDEVVKLVAAVHDLGMETCVTLGMLTEAQARQLKSAGLDYYNHNLDTSPAFYGQIITTRTYQDRLMTLANVQAAGLKLCSGGILGMGESRADRAALLQQLATLPAHPESVPINLLVQIAGTPLYGTPPLDPFECIRVVAAARIVMPRTHIRLSAGRAQLTDEAQALCYLAGANSIFYGDRLLTTANTEAARDVALFERLGLQFESFTPPGRDQPGGCFH